MFRQTSAFLTVLVLASCSAEEESPPSKYDDCMSVCEGYKKLECQFKSEHVNNQLTVLTSDLTYPCAEYCRQYANPPELDPQNQSCFERWQALVSCAARAGLHCVKDRVAAPPVVEGCDDESKAMADTCGQCSLLLSDGVPACGDERPMRWYCGTLPSKHVCYSGYTGCEQLSASEYCCAETYLGSKCDPNAAPICAGC